MSKHFNPANNNPKTILSFLLNNQKSIFIKHAIYIAVTANTCLWCLNIL